MQWFGDFPCDLKTQSPVEIGWTSSASEDTVVCITAQDLLCTLARSCVLSVTMQHVVNCCAVARV